MKRSKPMRRSRMKRKTARRVLALTADDCRWRQWLHMRPCVGESHVIGHVCKGRIEQSHERDMTGIGLKAPERRSVPMCSELHRAWEQHRGPFARWTKETRRIWLGALIDAENEIFERMDGVPW